jgi:hypothetical protein
MKQLNDLVNDKFVVI